MNLNPPKIKPIVLALLCLLPLVAYVQDTSTESVKKEANALFEKGEYQRAKELYSQLVSLYPRDENYNYRFGACMLYVDSDKSYPLKFLEYAVSKPNVDVAAFYFLGKGYHYNYQFDRAIVYFEKYLQKAAGQDGEKLPAAEMIRYCRNGRKLMNNIKNPRVLNVAKVSRADFFAAFKVRETGAKILFAPAEFHSSEDKKRGYTPVMYSNKKLNVIFYSSYGKSGKSGLDLYMVRIVNGEFTEPIQVSGVVNTDFDDAFAYLSNDGRTFFFASKGHNSMGGYDLFTSFFDSVNNSFTQPVNLDYVINTPDDDFMYAELPDEDIAFFASNRNSDKGKAFVYKIQLNSAPFEFAVIDGTFSSEATKSVKITVEDLSTHTEIGSFSSQKKDGKYVLRLESGGKYNFLVEPYGSEVAYQGRVDIPKGTGKRVLRQEIEIISSDGEERLVIRNLFEEGPQESDNALIAQVLAQNAKLKETPVPKVTASNEQIVAVFEEQLEQEKQVLDGLKTEQQISLQVANSYKEQAQQSIEEAESLAPTVSLNDVSEEGRQKSATLNRLISSAQEAAQKAESAMVLHDEYQQQIAQQENKVQEASRNLNQVQAANASGDRRQLEEQFETFNSSPEASGTMISTLQKEEESLILKGKRSLMKATVAEQELDATQKEISRLKAAQLATKKKKEKATYDAEIAQLEADIPAYEQDHEKYLTEAAEWAAQQTAVHQKIEVYQAIEQGKGAANPTAYSTQVETQALATSISETVKEIELVAEQFSEESKVAVNGTTYPIEKGDSMAVISNSGRGDNAPETSGNLATSETADNANSRNSGTAEVDAASASNSTSVDATNENSTVIAQESMTDQGATNTRVNPTETTSTGGTSTESVGTGVGSAVGTTALVAGSNTRDVDPTDSTQLNTESPPLGSNDGTFAYTDEYETPANATIEVAGKNIPLEITSNTGKVPYSEEELADVPLVLNSAPYNDTYASQQSKIMQETNSLEKAKQNQALQYEWVKSIEKERAALLYGATQTTNKNYAAQLSNKADELAGEAQNKRNYLALNARIIKQLSSEESDAVTNLDAVVTTSENQETTSPQTEISAQNEEISGEEGELANATTSNTETLPEQQSGSMATSGNSSSETGLPTDQNTGNGNAITVNEEAQGLASTANQTREGDVKNASTLTDSSTPSVSLNNEALMAESEFIPEVLAATTVIDQMTEKNTVEAELVTEEVASQAVTISEMEAQMAATKKKKDQRVLAEKMAKEQQKLNKLMREEQVLADRSAAIVTTQTQVIEDPVGSRPSQNYEKTVQKVSNELASAETELEELQFTLSQTKKKKVKKALVQEVNYAQRKVDSLHMEREAVNATWLAVKQTEEFTLKTATPYGTSVMVSLPEDSSKVSSEQAELVKSMPAYVRYQNQKNEAEKQIRDATVLSEAALEQMQSAKALNLKLEELDLLYQITSGDERAEIELQMDSVRKEQARLIKGADVYYTQAKAKTNEGYFQLNQANAQLLTMESDPDFDDILAVIQHQVIAVDSTSEKEIVVTQAPVTDENVDVIPQVLNQPIFRESAREFYSDSKPIPVNVKLPSGVVFKVQIGAFRNQIKQDAFKGFAPIVGEETATGLTRYTAGLFTNFDVANDAKGVIRSKGYSDAFVVAYYNGTRISIAKARQILAGTADSGTSLVSNTNEPSTDAVEQIVTDVAEQRVAPVGTGEPVAVQNTGVNSGLYFTVQVGVYNNRIDPNKVFRLSPLNAENIPQGLVRYSAGIYASIAEAQKARKVIVAGGISDAFVTAYYQGERITIGRAKELLGTQTTTVSSANVNNAVTPSSNRLFYVIVGPYSGKIPVTDAQVLFGLQKYGIKIDRNSEGTFYKIGNFSIQLEAETLKQELISSGLLNPKIVESGNE